jgi:ribonuclease HII
MKKGDAVAACVAAASIVAKVTRDRMMERYARRFRAYGFEHNRGYGTREHWDALDRVGPCPIHRLSFRGVSPETRYERVIVEDEWGDV